MRRTQVKIRSGPERLTTPKQVGFVATHSPKREKIPDQTRKESSGNNRRGANKGQTGEAQTHHISLGFTKALFRRSVISKAVTPRRHFIRGELESGRSQTTLTFSTNLRRSRESFREVSNDRVWGYGGHDCPTNLHKNLAFISAFSFPLCRSWASKAVKCDSSL